MSIKGLFVGGTFYSDTRINNGHSKIFDIMYNSSLEVTTDIDFYYINGGIFDDLLEILDNINKYDLIIWMPM